MTDSTIDHSKREVTEKQAASREKESTGDVQLLDRRAAMKKYGLNLYQMTQARDHGALKRYQVGGEGRWYYAEDQVRALAEHLRSRKSSDDYTFSWNAA